jgi:dTDP-4-amino-4,6-dideoxygalactose transaminase
MDPMSPYIPALPTLAWAHLRGTDQPVNVHPFNAHGVAWTYFGRNAVYLAARRLRLNEGEVLVPAYHHGVEVEALVAAGSSPVFYRVNLRWEVDLEDVERRIGPRTRALYLTHFGGFPGPARRMRALADRHGLALVEDCALALLSSNGEEPLGTTGDAAVFCLYKTLPVPHGGALVLRRPSILPGLARPPPGSTLGHVAASFLARAEFRFPRAGRPLRRVGRALGRGLRRGVGVEHVAAGSRHFDIERVRLGQSPLVERIVRAQDLPGVVERRRRNFFHLLGALRSVATPVISELPPGACPLFYPLWVEDKDEALARLRAENVEAIDFWRYFHPACDPAEFPEEARLRRHLLELPCHQDLGPEHVAHLAQAARKAVSLGTRPHRRAAQG